MLVLKLQGIASLNKAVPHRSSGFFMPFFPYGDRGGQRKLALSLFRDATSSVLAKLLARRFNSMNINKGNQMKEKLFLPPLQGGIVLPTHCMLMQRVRANSCSIMIKITRAKRRHCEMGGGHA